MNILIISNFPDDLIATSDGRFTYLAKLFIKHGHKVEMIVSDFEHAEKTKRKVRLAAYPFKITVLHEIGYSKNVCIKRLLSHWLWGRNVKKYISQSGRYDVVYVAIPSLTAARAASHYCKRSGAKFVVDLQDLWPEAFAMSIKNKILQKFFLLMKWYVDKIYAAADVAVAVSDTYVERILLVNKSLSSGISVYLGNNGDEFNKGRDVYKLNRTEDEIVVGYIGNMSTSYDIPCVLDALAKISDRGSVLRPIRFVLIGGGVYEEKFKQYSQEVYKNSTFLGRKSYQEMAGLLCGCDIVVNPIVKGSVASIINKVGDYALSGKPVINTQESEEYRNLIDLYQCGINCECGNSDDVADAIERLALNEELRKTMGANSARLGRERFDRRFTYQAIVNVVENCVK